MADIQRADVATIIQEAYSHVLLDSVVAASSVLQAFPTVNMGSKLTHLPVLATLPNAAWVTESSTDPLAIKPTDKVTWKDQTLSAEEVAVIIPVHENVLDDATVDVITEITQRGGEAIGAALDAAVLFGTNKPASWVSQDLHSAAHGATQYVANVTGAANTADLVGAVVQAARFLAARGMQPDTLIAPLTFRYDIINIRDSMGAPIFRDEQFQGFNTIFNRNGAWQPTQASLFVCDSSRVRIGIRTDIRVKLLDQATLTVGGTTVNLAERDMIGIRLLARYAYVLGTSTTRLGLNNIPVAAVVPPGGS